MSSEFVKTCYIRIVFRLALLTFVFAFCLEGLSQSRTSPAPTREISFETDEGTWMSVDVSPDGKTLVFDLLGQLYTLPIEGGVAQPLWHHAWAWDSEPRFSPDGKQILLRSDRGDTMGDVWLLEIKSGTFRQLFAGKGVEEAAEEHLSWTSKAEVTALPGWIGEENKVVAAVSSSGGKMAIVTTDVASGKSDWRSIESPGGRGTYIGSTPMSHDGRSFVVPTTGAIQSRLYQVSQGDEKPLSLTDPNSSYAEYSPQLSHDGRSLVYVRRVSMNDCQIRIRDLSSGEDRILSSLTGKEDNLTQSGNAGWTRPGYAFTPDDRSVVLSTAGKLQRIDIATGSARNIPFTAKVRRTIIGPLKGKLPLKDGPVISRSLSWPTLSRDHRRLAFEAGGDVWLRTLPNGAPKKLTDGAAKNELNAMPALSPDGSRIAYVVYPLTPTGIVPSGQLVIHNLNSGRFETMIAEGGRSYALPRWSPDGDRLAAVRHNADDTKDTLRSIEFGWVDPRTRAFNPVSTHEGTVLVNPVGDLMAGMLPVQAPSWSAGGRDLFVQLPLNFSDRKKSKTTPWLQRAISLDKGSVRDIAVSPNAYETSDESKNPEKSINLLIASPDRSHALLIGNGLQAYVADLPKGGTANLSLPVPGMRKIGGLGALFPYWESSDRLIFGVMDRVFAYSASTGKLSEVARTTVSLPRHEARETYAIRNARLITVAGGRGADPVIENGTLVVKGRRIVAAGPVDRVRIPKGAFVIDGTGLSIMPGIIDNHNHDPALLGYQGDFADNVKGLWARKAAVGYGITTIFTAGANQFAASETRWRDLIDSGRILGPREFSGLGANVKLDSWREESYQVQVETEIRRRALVGHGPCLKTWDGSFNRKLDRLIAQAAAKENLCIGGHTVSFYKFLTYVLDGIQPHHWGTAVPMYKDAMQLIVRSGTGISPNLNLWGGIYKLNGIIRRLPPQARVKAARWYSGGARKKFSRNFSNPSDTPQLSEFDAFKSRVMGQQAVELMRAGVRVAASADHEPAMTLRTELIQFQDAAATPSEIIRAATLTGAETLGLDPDIGSLEPGKIADFIVLTDNPMDDILNTILVKWTAIDGVIYDAMTIEELLPSTLTGPRDRSTEERLLPKQ